jgi:hypothetical protein
VVDLAIVFRPKNTIKIAKALFTKLGVNAVDTDR